MINDPEALYDPELWDTPGFTLVLSWLEQNGIEDAASCRLIPARITSHNVLPTAEAILP
jgi:hypothetical protein